MTETLRKSPDDIRALREKHKQMRERDFARIHGISEAELASAHIGHGVIRLNADVEVLLNGLTALGEIMALTRNESAVHEKIGPVEKVVVGPNASMVLGSQIDLRIFPGKWAFGFAVEKAGENGEVRRSLQFFDRQGNAVFKIHARPATDLEAWAVLTVNLTAKDQSPALDIRPALPIERRTPASAAELRERWSALTDTHQFFGMLRDLNLDRLDALKMAGEDYAWPLEEAAVPALFTAAAKAQLPIMVFVGNGGCIQIHSGPVETITPMGPWLNVMDPTFHLHLRLDQIAEVWAVRKPTKDGHVSSVEVYGADGNLIIQFFGKRKEGVDERAEWRVIVETLPTAQRNRAA
ncbi:hemin-degrading factor [Devosia nitrariae]|uniref:Hemin-degrading factor n=1 Tax=Devosia nitrariae TaxID=2071872 RepID=A0ABQ5W423_9HYPH|nr:ChuX/HutX family heme-like substrate-binding protein [Devosia nitrariae]GLQ54651.1 hemin-degrading factor [Devosia nitrariae]